MPYGLEGKENETLAAGIDKMIAIVDYGMGNLFSIYNALNHVCDDAEIISVPKDLQFAESIVIPGVGAFGMCMERILHFKDHLSRALSNGVPILGICIGMQMLFDESQESPGVRGLSWIRGQVVRLPKGVLVPQMGWNSLSIRKEADILEGIIDGDMFYFVHSYYCIPEDKSLICANTEYGTEVTAVIMNDNLLATQFHPEKSGAKGLKILDNFVRLTRC